MTKVSIITPSFNAAQWIGETIASIQAQTHADIEHIVVDGGSTDGTLDLVRAHPGIRLLVGKDRSMYDAINKGFAIATGQVLAYLNADDLYFPDSVERAVAAFAARPDLAGIYSDVELIDQHGVSLGNYRTLHGLDFPKMACSPVSLVPQPTAFWTRQSFDAVGGFDLAYRVVSDFDFFLKLAKAGPLMHVGRPLACFRLVPTSLTVRGGSVIPAEVAAIRSAHGIAIGPAARLRRLGLRTYLALLNWRGRSKRRMALAG